MTNQRLFKFRIWDAYLKILTQGEGLTVGFTDGKLSEASFYDKENCSRWSAMDQDLERGNRFFAQQFTGLTDSAGKEIYEGDILKLGSLHYEVMSINSQFIATCPNYCRYNWPKFENFAREARCSKIIGNIFENPELLQPCSTK
jgi:uncharacterized phage protein (TIGR01671 family)